MRRSLALYLFAVALITACGGAQNTRSTTEAPAAPPPAPTIPGMLDGDHAELEAHDVDHARLRCNSLNVWEPGLRDRSKADAHETLALFKEQGVALSPEQEEALHDELTDFLMWRYVRATVIGGNNNNLGVVPIEGHSTASGEPLLLFRSAFTPLPDHPDSCYRSLVDVAEVRHVINLYDGEIPTADLEAAERATVESAGGTYDTVRDVGGDVAGWRDLLREHPDDPAIMQRAQVAVAQLINEHILNPAGGDPAGNVHVHCGGGMHRTGMIVGVIERCINQTPMSDIAEAYKYHVSYSSDALPGGFEQENLDFIEAFDCALLEAP